MRLSKAFKKLGLLFVFLIIIFGVSLLNYDNVANALKSSIISFVESGQFESENFEETYNDDFYERIKWVDFNSLIVRAMDQKITNGVIKGENGKLNFLWSTEYKFDENTEKAKVGKAIQILKEQILYMFRDHGLYRIYHMGILLNIINNMTFGVIR